MSNDAKIHKQQPSAPGTLPALEIRRARPTDLETLYAFQLAMAHESEDVSLDPDNLRMGIEAVLADRELSTRAQELGSYWVAETLCTPMASAQVVGCLLVTTEWSDWRNGHIWWIQSVYVSPKYRRQGVYRALYLHLESLVKADPKLMGLRLYVEKENTSAREVYKKLGMTENRYIVCEWLKTDY